MVGVDVSYCPCVLWFADFAAANTSKTACLLRTCSGCWPPTGEAARRAPVAKPAAMSACPKSYFRKCCRATTFSCNVRGATSPVRIKAAVLSARGCSRCHATASSCVPCYRRFWWVPSLWPNRAHCVHHSRLRALPFAAMESKTAPAHHHTYTVVKRHAATTAAANRQQLTPRGASLSTQVLSPERMLLVRQHEAHNSHARRRARVLPRHGKKKEGHDALSIPFTECPGPAWSPQP